MSVDSRFCTVLELNEFEKENKFLLNVFTSGFYQINIAILCQTKFNLDRNLHNRKSFVFSTGSNFNCDVNSTFTGMGENISMQNPFAFLPEIVFLKDCIE